jgi:hypothetical protein
MWHTFVRMKVPNPLTERVGVNAVEAIFLNELNWAFREQTVSDYGIDAQVEVMEEGKPTGKLIALQIKSGEAYLKKRGDNFVFYGELRHLEYWTKFSLPVFLILHNPKTGETFWQKIERHLVTETDKGWSIEIPPENILNAKAKRYMSQGIASDDASGRRFHFAIDVDLMTVFEKKEAVFFVFDLWVNKSLSIRGIQVYYDDHSKAEHDLDFPYWAAGYSIYEFMRSRFPWLEYEYADDPEDHAGEVETHVLLVNLSEIAKKFLEVEEFFKTGEPFQDEPDYPSSGDYLSEEELNEQAMQRAIDRDPFN